MSADPSILATARARGARRQKPAASFARLDHPDRRRVAWAFGSSGSTIPRKGPLIEVSFETAEGVAAGKTGVQCRSVDVGMVETVGLTADLKGVIVTHAHQSAKPRPCAQGHALLGRAAALWRLRHLRPRHAGLRHLHRARSRHLAGIRAQIRRASKIRPSRRRASPACTSRSSPTRPVRSAPAPPFPTKASRSGASRARPSMPEATAGGIRRLRAGRVWQAHHHAHALLERQRHRSRRRRQRRPPAHRHARIARRRRRRI